MLQLGVLASFGLGLVGSLSGGLIAQLFGAGSIWRLDMTSFLLAVVSAIGLIAAAEAMTDRNSRHTA